MGEQGNYGWQSTHDTDSPTRPRDDLRTTKKHHNPNGEDGDCSREDEKAKSDMEEDKDRTAEHKPL